MTFIQRIVLFLMPKSSEEIQAESKSWVLTCPTAVLPVRYGIWVACSLRRHPWESALWSSAPNAVSVR
jgi:hypothetical protein